MTDSTEAIGAGGGQTQDQGVLEWEILLDRLEVEILWVERLLTASEPLDHAEWYEPNPGSPLPPHLAPRAQEIHSRQQAVIGRLMGAMRRSVQEQAYAQTAAREGDPTRPRYVDVAS